MKAAAKGLEKRPRIQDLRHTHVAWLILRGVPLPVIQQQLGHESIQTTIDVYGTSTAHCLRQQLPRSARCSRIFAKTEISPCLLGPIRAL